MLQSETNLQQLHVKTATKSYNVVSVCLCRGGMIQTGEQYEFVHHALSLYESRLSAETGQWDATTGDVDLNLDACWHIESWAGMISEIWEFSGIQELWRRSLSLMDNMDNQWGLLWVEPVEGKRKGKFLTMGSICSSSLLFLLRVSPASGSSEELERPPTPLLLTNWLLNRVVFN